MEGSRSPSPVGSGRLLPAFSSSELARKRLRHLSGSSCSSSCSSMADSLTPAKAHRAVSPTPAGALEGMASASLSAFFATSEAIEMMKSCFVPRTPAAASSVPTTDDTVMDADEGFTLVQKKKKEKKTPPAAATVTSTPSVPASASAPFVGVTRTPPQASEFPAFRVPHQEGFATSYDAVALLETNNANLKLRNIIGRDGSSVLVPLDVESYSTLDALASDPTSTVTLLKLDVKSQLTKGVVMGYPIRMPLTLLQRHPQVEEATRCVSSRLQRETRQVLISVRGPLPAQIDLKNWGVFYTRPFTPEPLRCYRCQKFGHHQASCSRVPVCGICSSAHPTQECLDKFKAHQETHPKCPNCNKRHHAWNLRCPARLQRVNSGRERQAQWVLDKQLTATVPAPPGTFVWGQQKVKPQPPPAAEDFPPLPSSPPKSVATQHTPPAPSPLHAPGTICITKDTLLTFANEITSTVAEVLIQAAGINIDLAAFQVTMERANAKIVDNLIATQRT